jgi:hypothetical protein
LANGQRRERLARRLEDRQCYNLLQWRPNHTNTNADPDTDRNANAEPDWQSNVNADADANTHTNTHTKRHTHSVRPGRTDVHGKL